MQKLEQKMLQMHIGLNKQQNWSRGTKTPHKVPFQSRVRLTVSGTTIMTAINNHYVKTISEAHYYLALKTLPKNTIIYY